MNDKFTSVFDQRQALMKCRTCGGFHWVKFKYRHAGKNPTEEGHSMARCQKPQCRPGSDYTDWHEGKQRQDPHE